MSTTGSARYVFVVTYGRSGSTLTQGLLNAMPRVLVRGENNFYILPMYRALALARSHKRRFGRERTKLATSAFYGLSEMDLDDFVRTTRGLVERQLLGSVDPATVDILGFKEVLWHRIRANEQEGFFDFLDDVFDRPRFVLNERNIEQVSTSGFWQRKNPEETKGAIQRVEQIQGFLRSTRPDRCFDTRYEVVTSKDESVVREQLRGLAEFVLGRCDEDLYTKLRGALDVGHGPNPFGASRRSRAR
jgi:hypothetical protein